MCSSIVFNQLNQHFQQKIYHSFKGALRLKVLNRDFDTLALHQQPLRILDIGAGEGQFALNLAQRGHDLTLLEPAESMLNAASMHFRKAHMSAQFIQGSLENLTTYQLGQFDLILCHAVLEWQENPFTVLPHIHQSLKAQGTLSLLFYNLDGLIMHNLIRGNFRMIQQKKWRGDPGGLTPISPIDPQEMADHLAEYDLILKYESGIRVFHDYMSNKNKDKVAEKERLEMELTYSTHPAFIRSARYLHWVLTKHA